MPYIPGEGGFPSAFHETLLIAGVPAELTCTRYEDRVYISVAQRPSIGTLISGTATRHLDGSTEFAFKTLLGSRDGDEWLGLAARRVLEAVFSDTGLPLLLALSLDADSEAAARDVIAAVQQYTPWRPAAAPRTGASDAQTAATPVDAQARESP